MEMDIFEGYLNKCTGNDSSVTVPEGVITIGDYAFEGQITLKQVILPLSLEHIESDAFNGCVNLENVVCNSSKVVIGEHVFDKCSKLFDESGFIIIGNTVCGYKGKEKTLKIPDTVSRINPSAFSNNKVIQKVIIPGRIKNINLALLL